MGSRSDSNKRVGIRSETRNLKVGDKWANVLHPGFRWMSISKLGTLFLEVEFQGGLEKWQQEAPMEVGGGGSCVSSGR